MKRTLFLLFCKNICAVLDFDRMMMREHPDSIPCLRRGVRQQIPNLSTNITAPGLAEDQEIL